VIIELNWLQNTRNGFATNYDSQITIQTLPFSFAAVQFQELHGWRLFELDAEVVADLAQAVIEMREMVQGHVTDERAADFVIARAPVQPANEEK
jgi:hypothetical protein